MAEPTTNELLHDSLVRRQVYLSRYSKGLSNRIVKLLDATDADLRGVLLGRLAEVEGKGITSTTTARLKVLENVIRKLRGEAFDSASDMWDEELRAVAIAQADYLDSAVQDFSPVVLDTVVPTATQLGRLITTQPFQGKVMSEWAEGIAETDLDRIMNVIKIGMVHGETSEDITRRVVGAGQLSGADGVVQLTRNDASSITRTAISHVANQAMGEWSVANDDIINEERYTATLDSHTTLQCISLDGQVYAVGEGPVPPVHWNCRSVRVPVIDGKVIGSRPAVAVLEDDFADLSGKERRAKVAELVGVVPAETTYGEFLGRQTKSFQDDVLGATRGDLFRGGKLSVDKFVDHQGNTYTLDELRQREPAAFRRAGL